MDGISNNINTHACPFTMNVTTHIPSMRIKYFISSTLNAVDIATPIVYSHRLQAVTAN